MDTTKSFEANYMYEQQKRQERKNAKNLRNMRKNRKNIWASAE